MGGAMAEPQTPIQILLVEDSPGDVRRNADPGLKTMPVIVLTTSEAEQDILRSYQLAANAYITKPIDLNEFIAVVRSIENFWLSIVRLPDQAS
jgi:CheY-like chemotaxis protein